MIQNTVKLKTLKLKDNSIITGILVFLFYLITVGRSIGEFDSGELALAQATFSIPHPTGYPLFSILGYLFNLLPLPVSTIFKLNILNSVWCALTIMMLIKSVNLLLGNLQLIFNHKFVNVNIKITDYEIKILSTFSGFMLAFSATFWLQSTKVEVYALQIFITSLIIYYTLKIIVENFKVDRLKEYQSKDIIRESWLIALLFGLGFSNHLMTVYLLPASILVFIFIYGIKKESLKAFVVLIVITSSVALIFYLLLMFRAQMSPPWSYGDPSNINRLVDHVTAKEYTKYFLSDTGDLLKQGSKLLKMLSYRFSGDNISLGEFGPNLFIGIAGFLLLFLLKKEIALYFLINVVLSLIIALSYSIPDINEYFLVMFFLVSLAGSIPLTLLLQYLKNRNIYYFSFYSFLVVLSVSQIWFNFNYANRANFFVIEDFYKTTINSLPKNSTLLSDNWEIVLSPSLFYQNVEQFRKDVTIISPSGYILFGWYRQKNNTSLYDSSLTIIPRKNLFVTFDVAYKIINKNILRLPEHSTLIPLRSLYVVGVDTVYYPLENRAKEIRFSKYLSSGSEEYIRVLIPTILEQRINYEIAFKQYLNAKNILEEIKSNFPEYKISEFTLVNLYKYKII